MNHYQHDIYFILINNYFYLRDKIFIFKRHNFFSPCPYDNLARSYDNLIQLSLFV